MHGRVLEVHARTQESPSLSPGGAGVRDVPWASLPLAPISFHLGLSAPWILLLAPLEGQSLHLAGRKVCVRPEGGSAGEGTVQGTDEPCCLSALCSRKT